ncbi:MAG: hypothetical protein AB1439_01395 [candidate division FCPU426 bacterium]
MGNVKATRWLDVQEFIAKTYGSDGVRSVLDSLAPEDQALWRQKIVPVMWLDYGAYLRYMFAADKVLGKGDYSLIDASARYTARKHFSGIYKFFISLTSPHFVIKRAAQVWRQYFDVGKMEVIEEKDHLSILQLSEYPDIPLNHEFSHTPFMEELVRMSNGKNPRGKHPKCMARKDEYCLWEFTWE